MNWLFDNPLILLPGLYFLMLYGFVIVSAAIAFKIIKSRLDYTGEMPLPPIPSEPDPFEIAYLRGGANELARAATFALNQKGLVEISQYGKDTFIQQTAKANPPRLNPLERAVFNFYSEPRKPKELFQSDGLKGVLQPFTTTYEARLSAQHFLTDGAMKSQIVKYGFGFAAIVVGLGVYKLIGAQLRGYSNVGFLIIMGIIGVVILGVMSNTPRLTKHGKNYLERLQLAFEKLKYSTPKSFTTQNQQPAVNGFAAVDPLLLSVGIFGTAALAGTAYDNYNQAFHKAQQAQTSGGSSCGSGCGSSSDSSSCSSGDGGGGCGGGGCGGCG